MPANFARDTRTTAAIGILILCCLLSSARMILSAPHPLRKRPDGIASRSDERFAVLKSRLPTEGVVGYVGEPGESALPDYYLTQYALAPLVVDQSAAHAIVIGNFPTSQTPNVPPDLHLIEDFGNGVLLFAGREIK